MNNETIAFGITAALCLIITIILAAILTIFNPYGDLAGYTAALVIVFGLTTLGCVQGCHLSYIVAKAYK